MLLLSFHEVPWASMIIGTIRTPTRRERFWGQVSDFLMRVKSGRFPSIEKDMKMVLAHCGSLFLDPASLWQVRCHQPGMHPVCMQILATHTRDARLLLRYSCQQPGVCALLYDKRIAVRSILRACNSWLLTQGRPSYHYSTIVSGPE